MRRPGREPLAVTWLVHGGLAERIRSRSSPQLAECALHFLTTLAVRAQQLKVPDDYIVLHSGILRSLYTTRYHGPMLRLLHELRAIECHRSGYYRPEVSSRAYRLPRDYRAIEAIPAISASVVARARFIYRSAAFGKANQPAHRWILQSYMRSSFCPALTEILKTHLFRSSMARLAVLHTVGTVQRYDVEFHPDRRTGRVYYPIANLPKILRRELRLDDQPTVEIDIAACQPTLLATLYPDYETQERAEYLALVQGEHFYETIAGWVGSGWTREEAKEAFFSQIAFSYAAVWTKLPLYSYFAARFPKLTRWIATFKCRHKAHLPLKMQRLEASIMIQGVCADCATRKIQVLPVHDSIICKAIDAPEVEGLITTHRGSATGLPCQVRVQGHGTGQ